MIRIAGHALTTDIMTCRGSIGSMRYRKDMGRKGLRLW